MPAALTIDDFSRATHLSVKTLRDCDRVCFWYQQTLIKRQATGDTRPSRFPLLKLFAAFVILTCRSRTPVRFYTRPTRARATT